MDESLLLHQEQPAGVQPSERRKSSVHVLHGESVQAPVSGVRVLVCEALHVFSFGPLSASLNMLTVCALVNSLGLGSKESWWY